MWMLLTFLLALRAFVRSRVALQREILALRHPLQVLVIYRVIRSLTKMMRVSDLRAETASASTTIHRCI
jgi:hypothetical protein